MSTRQYGRQQSLGLVTFGNPPTGEREEHTPRSTLSRMFSGWMTPNISRTPHDVIGSPTADAAHLFVHKKSSNLSRLSSRSSTATPDTPVENEGKSFKRQVSKSRSLNSVRESHTHADILPHNEPRTSDWVKQRILSLGDILATRDDESDHSIYWAPDDQCRSCYQCGAQFTTFRRRHHCRICGQIYCWNCCHSRVDCSTVGIDEVMRLCVFCEKIVNDSSASIKETEVDDGRDSASSVDQLPTSTFLSKSVLPPTRFDSDREVASTAHLFIPPSFTGSARRAAKLKAEALNEEKKNVVSKPVELDIIISSPKLNTRASASADGISVALPQKSDTGSGGVDENEKEKAGVADQSVGVNEDSTGMHKALLDDGPVKRLKSEPMTVINFDMGSGKQTPVIQTASTITDSIDAGHIPDDGVDLKGISVIMMKNIIAHALAIPGKFKLGDRRFRLKTYSNCFVASDFIDWLLLGEYVSDRDAAIELGERMVSHDLIKSAADHENSFRDDYLLFRFTDTATAKPPIATRYSIANLVPRPCMPNSGKEPSVSDGIYYQPAVPNLQRGKDTLDMSLAKHRVKRSNSFFANLPGVDMVRSSSLDPGILASLPSLSSGDLDTARFKPGALSDMKQQFGGTSVATDLSRSKSSVFKPLGGGHSISVIKPIPRLTKLQKEEESVIGSTTSKLPDAHEQSESAVDRLVESHTNRHSRTISRNAEADILLHNSSGEPLKLGQNPRLRGKEFKSKLSNQVPVQPSTDISLREQKKTEDQYIRFISDAVRQRRLRMCSQILCDMGLSVSWVSTVESLAQEAVVQVRTPALGSADPMDIRQWIKTKIIPYGAKSDSQCIHGVVCAQHLVHKKMRTDITNPRILLLNSSIEYDQTHAITSMEDVFKKDQLLKSLQLQIDLIKCHRPDVVLVSGSVAYKAQEMFLAENISLAVNVKRSTLDFVKRCTGAEIQESMAEMRVSKTSIVGTCGCFFIGTVTAGKPLMYFTECNPRRGVTITLRGADEATLKKVKQALSFITFVSYCGFIESFYLSDVFAVIPEDERDKKTIACNITDNPKKSHRDRFCSLANQSVLSTSPMVDFDIPYLYSSKGKAMLSYFPSGLYTTRRLQSSNYQTLPIDLRTAYLLKQHPAEREPKKHLLSNPLPKPFDAVRTDWDSRSKYHPGKDIHFAMLHDERQPMETQAASDANGESQESQFSNRKLASWDALNPAMHQSIQVLYSVELPGNGEQPARMCLKPKKMDFYYYGDKDQSLGSFLSRYCFNTHACPSETCDRPLSEHKRIFSHQDARISFINIPSNVIRGQEQTLLMWSICHECMKYGPCIPVSEETWCMSFGKFLELSFHEKTLGCRVTQITNESGMMKLVEDKHSFHRNHNRYYGLNDQAVVVQYDKIDMLLEVVVPPTIVTSKPVPLKCGEFLSDVFQLQKEMQMLFESLSLQLACLYVRARESGSQTFASHAHKLLRRSFIEASLYGSRVDQIARHAHAKHIHGQSHTESELGGTTDDFDDEDEESLRSALPEGTYVSDSSRRSSALQEGDHVDSDVSSLNVSRMSSVVSTNVSATVSSVPVEYVAPEENTTTMTTVSVHEEDDDNGLNQPAVEGVEGAILAGSNASSRGIPETVSGVEVAAINTNRTNEYDTPRDAELGEGISNMLPCVRERVADNVTDISADSLPAIPSKEMTALAENSDLQCSRSKSIPRDSMTQVIPLSAGDQIGKDTINEIIKAHQLDTSTISDITGRPFREGPPSLTPDLIEDKGDSEASAHGAKSNTIEVVLPNGEKENENVRDQLSPPPEVGGDNPALQRDLILAKEHTEAMERSKKYIQMRKASQVSDGSIPMQTYHRFASLANAPTTIIRTPAESDHPAVPDAAELDSPGVRAGEDEDVSLTPNAEEVSGPPIVQTSPEEDDDARDRSYSRELPPPLPDCEFTSNGRYPSARLNIPAPPQTDIPRDSAETQEDCVRELPPPLPVSPSESEEEELLGMEPPSFLSVDIQNYDDAQFDGDEKTLPASEVASGDGAEEMLSDDPYQIPVSDTRLPGSLLRLEPIKPEMRRSISAASSAALALEKFERSSMSLRARAEESNNAKNKMQPCGSAPLPRKLTARSFSLFLPLQGTQDEDTGDPLNGTQGEGTGDFGDFSSYKFTSIEPSPTPERKTSANSILTKAKANLKPLTGFAELLDESPHPMGFVSSSTQAPSAGLSLALDDRTAQPLIRHATFPRMISLTLGQGSDSLGYNSPGMLAEDAAAGVPLPPAVDLLDDEAIFGEPMVTGPPAMNVVDDAGASVNQISTESSIDIPTVAGSPVLGTNKPIDFTQSAKPISSAAVRFLESGEKASVVADDKGEAPPLEILPRDCATSPTSSTAPPSPVLERADTLESEAAYIEAKSVFSDSTSKPTPPSIENDSTIPKIEKIAGSASASAVKFIAKSGSVSDNGVRSGMFSPALSLSDYLEHQSSRASMTDRTAPGSPASVRSVPTQSCIVDGESESAESTMSADPLTIHSDLESHKSADVESNDVDFQEAGVSDSESLQNPSDVVKATKMIDDVPIIPFNTRRLSKKVSLADLRGEEIFNPDATVADDESPRTIDTISEKEDDHDDESYMLTGHAQGRRSTDVLMHAGSADRLIFAKKSQLNRDSSNLRSKASSVSQTHQSFQPTKVLRRHSLCEKNPCEECESDRVSNQDAYLPNTEAKASKVNDDKTTLQMASSTGANATSKVSKIQSQRKLSEDILSDIDLANKDTNSPSTVVDTLPSTSSQANVNTQREDAGLESTILKSITEVSDATSARISDQELVGLHVTLMSDIDELVTFWNTELRRAYASSISAKDNPTKSPKNEGHSRWNTPVDFINLPFEMNDPNFDPAVELGTSPTSSIKQDARQPTSFLNVGSVMAAVQRARSSSYQNEDEKKNEGDNGTSRDMEHLRGKENVLLNSGLITPEEAIHSRSRFMTTAHIGGLQSDAYFEDWSDLLLSPRHDQFSVDNFDLNTMDLTPNAVMSPTSITNKSPFWRISSKVTELDDNLISAEAVALLPRRKFGQSLEEVTQEIGTQTPPQEQRAPVSSRNFGSLMSRIRAGTSDPIAAMTHGIVPMDNFVTSSIDPRAVTSTPARFETDEAPAAPGTGEASDIYIEIGDQSDSSALRALASQPPPIFAMNTDITPSISDLGSQIVPKRSVSPRSSAPSAEPPRPPLTPIPSQSQDFYDFSLLDSVAAKKFKDDMETLCRSITRKTQPPPKQQLSVTSLSKAHYQLPATELPYIMLIDDEPSTLIAYFLASIPYRKKLNEAMTVRPRTESSASGYNTAGNPSVFENKSSSAAGGENANAAEPNPMKPAMTKQNTGGGPPDARKASRLKNVHNIAKENGAKTGGSPHRDTSNDLMKPISEVLDEKATGRADRQGVLSKLDLSANTPERTTQLRYTSASPSAAPTTAYFKTASQQKKSQGKQPKQSIASQAPVRIPYTSIGGVDAPSVMNMINNRGQYSPNSGMLRVPADTSNGVGSVANMLGAEEPTEDSPSFSADGQDRKGSESPHIQLQVVDDTTVFGIRIVWARRFHRLRELCTEGEDKFIRSLSRCAVWEATGGKSGSTFLRTLDGRYVLKQMSRVEVASVIDLSEAYLKYMFESIKANRPTVLAKVLGIYQISMVDRKTSKTSKVAFIVMENVFYGRKIDVAFDLKGSQRSRYAETSDKNAVLLDENFVEFITDTPIYLRGHTKLVLETAVASDALFLCNNNVMDYSLLIGINYESKELVVGIIDYIRTYTLDKKMETWVKSSGILGGSGKMPTVISPNLYMKRFRTAVEDYFIRLPDKWTGKTIPLSYPDLYRDLKGPATEATNNTTLSHTVQTDSDTARAKTHSAGDEKEKARLI